MLDLRQIAFVLEDFELGKPSQQLLDRFLIGYPREGEFHQIENCTFTAHLESGLESPGLARTRKEFGLRVVTSPQEAVRDTDAVLIAWRGAGAVANDTLLESIIRSMKPGARCFVHGRLARDGQTAARFSKIAQSREISLSSGTATNAAFRLPNIDVKPGSKIREALIVVQGPRLEAELEALNGLLPLLEKRLRGESGEHNVLPLKGEDLQDALDGRTPRVKELLSAAISRSNTIQGDPVKDGRTQDIVGLGLVKQLAKEPRGWVIDHMDGVRSTILVLNGVLADFNVGIRLENGEILSAQLYRPPPPREEHFSQFAARIEDFFRTGKSDPPSKRGILIAEILNRMESADVPMK